MVKNRIIASSLWLTALIISVGIVPAAHGGRDVTCEHDWSPHCTASDGPHTVRVTYDGEEMEDVQYIQAKISREAYQKLLDQCKGLGFTNTTYRNVNIVEDRNTCTVRKLKHPDDKQENPPLFPYYSKCKVVLTATCVGAIPNPNPKPRPEKDADPEGKGGGIQLPTLSDQIDQAAKKSEATEQKAVSGELDELELGSELDDLLESVDSALDEEYEDVKTEAKAEAEANRKIEKERTEKEKEEAIKQAKATINGTWYFSTSTISCATNWNSRKACFTIRFKSDGTMTYRDGGMDYEDGGGSENGKFELDLSGNRIKIRIGWQGDPTWAVLNVKVQNDVMTGEIRIEKKRTLRITGRK